jgi:hypothetical protein
MQIPSLGFNDALDEATQLLMEREAERNKWLNADGTQKKNYWWKYASKTKQGDAGESVVRTAFELLFSYLYGNDVECNIVNKGKGDYDVLIVIPALNKEIRIEVKTATEDVNGSHQFNGLKKNIGYDYAFLFGVAPENYFFLIESHDHLAQVMTTNMSKNVEGAWKYTVSQKNLKKFNEQNMFEELIAKGVIDKED